MDDDTRLQWVMRNRTRRSRVRPIGESLQRCSAQLGAATEAARGVAAAIAPVVDADFREHCRVGLADGGTCVVSVDSPSLVYSMRQRWLSPLRTELTKAGSGRWGRKIVFVAGTGGVRVDQAS